MRRFHWWNSVVVAVMVCTGFGIALSSTHRFEPLWQVWTALVLGLCGAAGLVGAYGLATWRRLSETRQLPRRKTTLPAMAVTVGALLVVVAAELFSPRPGSEWRGDVLVTLSVSGGAFAGAAMFGVRVAVRALPISTNLVACEIAAVELIALRRLLHRLASALGSLVTLSTLALGAAVLMSKNQPREVIIVFGGFGAATVAAFYAPAATAIRARGEQLVTAIFTTNAPQDAGELIDRVEQRAKLEQHIGVDRTSFGDLQTAIPVLGPLVAAAAVLLPK